MSRVWGRRRLSLLGLLAAAALLARRWRAKPAGGAPDGETTREQFRGLG